MDKKQLFNEALTSLVEFSAVKGNKITMEDVKLHFKDLIDDESQYHFIYDYLAVNKITIEGFNPNTDRPDSLDESKVVSPKVEKSQSAITTESEEELAFIEMYMQDLQSAKTYNQDEINSLLLCLMDGNLSVVNDLVECHLPLVAEIAETYRGRGATFGDLIQEGNLALMLAISDYTENEGSFSDYIKEKITVALDSAVNSQINSERISRHLADQLNRLDEVTKDLSEKLGRVPDVEELSEAMSISSEQVETLLKTSLDTLSLNEDTQITDEEDMNNNMDTMPKADPLEWRVNKK